jgi:succinate dehydrogenase / fumarate reductase, flavoprotein subunit
VIHERLPGIAETRTDLRRGRRYQGTDPGAADGALQHGRHPTNFHGEVVRSRTAIRIPWCPGCSRSARRPASVHGANRLGSNSLLDLIVFGRAVANRCAELLKPAAASGDPEASRFDGRPADAFDRCATPG